MDKILRKHCARTFLILFLVGTAGGCTDTSIIHHSTDDEWKQQQGIEATK
jgi:hypothetical protein